jgi:hypothetical protein
MLVLEISVGQDNEEGKRQSLEFCEKLKVLVVVVVLLVREGREGGEV